MPYNKVSRFGVNKYSPGSPPIGNSRRNTLYSQRIVKTERYSQEATKSITCQESNVNDTDYREIQILPRHLPRQDIDYHIEDGQKWLELAGLNGRIHRFPLRTIMPKVQRPNHVPAKELPRDVEEYRRRCQFDKVNIMQELKKLNLDGEELLPTEEQFFVLSENAFKHFLPISFFDDSSFDSQSPEAWLDLGVADGVERCPLPAKAFLPVNQNLLQHRWQDAAVSSYNENTKKWTAMVLADELVYEVPSIQVMFMAENPHLFLERLKQAVNLRNKAESSIIMEIFVGCVLLQDLEDQHFYGNYLVDRLMANVQTDEKFYQLLRTEIYLVFENLMSRYEVNKFIKTRPKELPRFNAHVTEDSLPKAFPSTTTEEQLIPLKLLKINLAERILGVLAYSLYYTEEGIEAMLNVVSECLYIETLNLFVCSFNKALPLTDFLTSQQQQSNNVANYLKMMWPSKIAAGILIVLKVLCKGWLDVNLNKWSVYQICKISRFVLQVKFRMQDSMQVLLEKSIHTFTHFLSEPCLQFLSLSQTDYQWTSDFIHTEFPYTEPIFALIISVTEDKEVVYSTAPEEFAPALKEVFKKGLESTSGVRCIDGETMTNLRFAPNLFILTVELIEELYVICNDLLQDCYKKGTIPLHAYAHKYDRFIDFYLLDVQTYIDEYRAAKKPSMQIKTDILEHKRCKEEMRAILPETITIGPFLVIVDPMKQYMINKRMEIVRKIFEYYVDRMYDTNEHLLERCLEVYNRINVKPQSIEHLYDIKEFASTIPELVDQLRADIQIMWIEYDMLDSFFYNLSDHQFAMKWEVYAWPKNILERLSTLKEEQKNDIEEFKRLHLSECIGFEERLQSLNDEIQQYSLQFNPQKVMETAVEVKKTSRIIQDLQKLGQILRHRQELFELEELSLEFLDSIIKGFLPYKNLWYACQDLVKLEEATVGNPIANIQLDDVWEAAQIIKNSLHNSLEVFSEKPEIQDVAWYFLRVLDEFVPKYNAIKDLKNQNWLFLHWQELALRSGMDIKYSMAMNFQYCMRKGMMDHLDLVHEISEKATNEADAIRKAWEEEERRKEEERQAILMRKAMRKCRTDIV